MALELLLPIIMMIYYYLIYILKLNEDGIYTYRDIYIAYWWMKERKMENRFSAHTGKGLAKLAIIR